MIIEVRIAKTDEHVVFDTEKLPAASMQYLLNYGATQAVNDAAASIVLKNYDSREAFEEDVRAKVARRVDQITTGDVPGSRAPADPAKKKAQVAAFLKNLSKEDLRALLAEVRA